MGAGASSDSITVLSKEGAENFTATKAPLTLTDPAPGSLSARDDEVADDEARAGRSDADHSGGTSADARHRTRSPDRQLVFKDTDRQGSQQLWSDTEDAYTKFNDPSKTPSTNAAPATIAEFELIAVVGQGGFGKVWKARRKRTGEIFAIKIQSIDVKKERLEALNRERKIMQEIDCPFIVKLHWSLENYSSLYLVLDYIPGGTLFKLQSDRPTQKFSAEEMQFYTMEIFLGLEHLHAQNIIFRDLKPENIMVNTDGHVMLTDFGLSKAFNEQNSRHKSVLGTPEYMAPEMIWGNGYGIEVDFWALGCLLYEGLFSVSPFIAESTKVMFTKILGGKLYIPEESPDHVKSVIRGLLTCEPVDRVDAKGLRAHPFFSKYEWEEVASKKVLPPIIPMKSHPTPVYVRDGSGSKGSCTDSFKDGSFRDYWRKSGRNLSPDSNSDNSQQVAPTQRSTSASSEARSQGRAETSDDAAAYHSPTRIVTKEDGDRISPAGTPMPTPSAVRVDGFGRQLASTTEVEDELYFEYFNNHPAKRGNDHVPNKGRLLMLLDKFVALRSASCLERDDWEEILDECFCMYQPSPVYRKQAGLFTDGGHLKVLLGIDAFIMDLKAGRGDIKSTVPGFTGELRYSVDHRHVILGHHFIAWSGYIESVHCKAKTPMILRMGVSKDLKIIKVEQTQDVLGFGRQMLSELHVAERKVRRALKGHKSAAATQETKVERDSAASNSSESHGSGTDRQSKSTVDSGEKKWQRDSFGDVDDGFFSPTGASSQELDMNENSPSSHNIKSVTDCEFIKVIGKGDFSTVWSAKRVTFTDGQFDQARSDEVVAVKVQEKSRIAEFGGVDRVVAERNLHLQLEAGGSSPFIVQMLGAFQSRNYFFIELEYIESGTLFEVQDSMPGHRFPIDAARFFCAEVVSALGHIHERGVIYRDLKPENVMVDLEGHIKLIDFGLAVQGPSFVVEKGVHVGNVEYVSPEVLMDQLAGYAVDWWAFGCLLFEMTTGISPFFNDKINIMHDQIIVGVYHPLEQFIPEKDLKAEPGLPGLLNRLFESSPTKRDGFEQTTKHSFFNGIRWDDVKSRRLPLPILFGKPADKTTNGTGSNESPIGATEGDTLLAEMSSTMSASQQVSSTPRDMSASQAMASTNGSICSDLSAAHRPLCETSKASLFVSQIQRQDTPMPVPIATVTAAPGESTNVDSPPLSPSATRKATDSSQVLRPRKLDACSASAFHAVTPLKQDGGEEKLGTVVVEPSDSVQVQSSSVNTTDSKHEWQYHTVAKFFKYRSETVTDAKRWKDVVCELFVFAQPQLPYRNQAASAVCPSTNLHVVIGIDELLLDMDYANQTQAWQVSFELIPSEFYSKRCRSLAALNISFGPPEMKMKVRGAAKIQFSDDKRLLRLETCFDINAFMGKWKTLCSTASKQTSCLSPEVTCARGGVEKEEVVEDAEEEEQKESSPLAGEVTELKEGIKQPNGGATGFVGTSTRQDAVGGQIVRTSG